MASETGEIVIGSRLQLHVCILGHQLYCLESERNNGQLAYPGIGGHLLHALLVLLVNIEHPQFGAMRAGQIRT